MIFLLKNKWITKKLHFSECFAHGLESKSQPYWLNWNLSLHFNSSQVTRYCTALKTWNSQPLGRSLLKHLVLWVSAVLMTVRWIHKQSEKTKRRFPVTSAQVFMVLGVNINELYWFLVLFFCLEWDFLLLNTNPSLNFVCSVLHLVILIQLQSYYIQVFSCLAIRFYEQVNPME